MSQQSDPAGAPQPMDEPVDLDFDAAEPTAPPPDTRWWRRPRLVSAAVVLALVLVGAGGAIWSHHSTKPVAKVMIRGTIILTNAETLQANCVGQGSYQDLHAGTDVILTNEAGDTIGRTTLTGGEPDYDDGICSYPFTFTRVPTDSTLYYVEVAHRGKIRKTRAELAQSGWTYFLALT
jgi:hypothetical protein